MRSDPAPVAVVGGGFSGVMTAVQLARRGVPAVLLDGSGRMGRGVAYSTSESAHLLNVPSGKMSAWPDLPEDFAQWLGDDGTSFAERLAFGAYLESILREAKGVRQVGSGVIGAERDGAGWHVQLENGELVEASALVLANGNQPPREMAVARGVPDELFVTNPWSTAARQAVERAVAEQGDVLLLGTGLTMVDTLLSLDSAGHRGRVVALSRRGLLPRTHAPHTPVPVEAIAVPHGNLPALWRWLRRRSAEVGFRAAVDSLRPHSAALWQSFGAEDRRRFLRHARPWWDVHRHRIAPQVGRHLAELVADGRLEITAGRIRRMEDVGGELSVSIARRSSKLIERRFSVAFNCTGPLGEMRRTRDPLLRQMLGDGSVRVDDLGMGLAVADPGRAGDRLWAVGPLTKGTYWEIVAVPDIRGQAAAIAEDIVRELGA